MIYLGEVFKDKKLNTGKLPAYGFTGNGDYIYRTDIEEDFQLLVTIKDGVIDYSLIECSTQCRSVKHFYSCLTELNIVTGKAVTAPCGLVHLHALLQVAANKIGPDSNIWPY